MKGADNDALQLRQALHESFKPSHACICSAQAHHSHDQNDDDDADFLHLDLEAFHGSSSHHDANVNAVHRSPLLSKNFAADYESKADDDQGDVAAFGDDKFGRVCDDYLSPPHHEAFHGSSDCRDVAAAASHCALHTQSLSADQEKSSNEGDEEAAVDHLLHNQAFHGCSNNASHAEAGLRASSVQAHPHCDIIRQQARSIEADYQCEDKKHTHVDDHLHQALHESSKIQCSAQERSALRCRSSLAQAFSAEDYNETLTLRGQSRSTGPLCGVASERSNQRKVEFSSCRYNSTSPCMHSLAYSNTTNKINLFDAYDNRANYMHDKHNIIKEPYNYKVCSTSYKYPMQEHYNSYIMRGVLGLAFKWRPTLGSFNMRSLFGGHLHKASSARVWVHEEEASSNLDAKLSTHTPPLCPHYHTPSITGPSSYPKSITSDDSSENSAKCSSTYGKSPRYSPLSRCINGISTKDSPILTRFGSNLGGSLSSYSYCGSASFNCASSSTNASKCSSKDSLFSASSLSSNHSSKSIDKKVPQEPKLKRLQGLFNRKHFNVHLFNLGKSRQKHGYLSNNGNGKNARFIDRNCSVSYSFHEELPKDSIQGAIAHCKQSMATTKTSHDNFVLP